MTETAAPTAARFTVTFGSYEDAYIVARCATEDEAKIAAAEHCLDMIERQRRMPDPFTIERDVEQPAASPFGPADVAADDTLIDMMGMATTSTAAVLAIRHRVNTKHEQAKAHYLAAQHSSYAVGRGRAMVTRDTWRQALELVDAVIAERLS